MDEVLVFAGDADNDLDMAGVEQCALPRARMYALASLGLRPLLRGNLHCQEVRFGDNQIILDTTRFG